MSGKKILLAGCGDLGLVLGQQLQQQGFAVTGLKRSPLSQAPFPIINADLLAPESLQVLNDEFDFIVYSATPGDRTPQAYKATYIEGLNNLMAATAQPKESFLLVSSTGVYGQSHGEWIDETSPAEPSRFSGEILLESEHLATATWANTIVVRFAGIYGPGRLRLVHKVQQREPVVESPPKYTNRIYRDDCVGMLAFLIAEKLQGTSLQSLYLGCDNAPVPDYDVLDFIADQLGQPKLPRHAKPGNTVNQNKRCSNQRIRDLGYRFNMPSYREGYRAILKAAGLLP